MREKAEYKSAKRSRKLIRTAFAKLMLEKPLDKITITDIVKEADLNRGTFYAHYQSPYGVIEEVENEIMDNLIIFLDEASYRNFCDNPLPLILKVNRYLEEELEEFKMLIQCSTSEQFLNRLKELFVSHMEEDERIPTALKETKEFKATTYFIAGGIIEIYKRWFHEELEIETLDDLAKCVSENIKDYARRFLGVE